MARKVVVTGGCGFIGSHVVDELVQRGYEVRVLSRPHCDLSNLAHHGSRVERVELDVRDHDMDGLLRGGVEGVLHFAASISVDESALTPTEYLEVNVMGTMNVLEAVRVRKVPRFLHMSTCEVYGNVPSGRATEEHPLDPRSPYAASKFAAERYLLAYSYTYPEMSIRIARGFNQFGPRQSAATYGAVVPKLLTRALRGEPIRIFGDGNQTRDYVFVKDTARGIVDLYESDVPSGEIVNFATGKETSVRQLAERVCAVTGRDPARLIQWDPARPGEIRRSCGDSAKAQRLLGWKPTVDFDEGLRRTAEWFTARVAAPASPPAT